MNERDLFPDTDGKLAEYRGRQPKRLLCLSCKANDHEACLRRVRTARGIAPCECEVILR